MNTKTLEEKKYLKYSYLRHLRIYSHYCLEICWRSSALKIKASKNVQLQHVGVAHQDHVRGNAISERNNALNQEWNESSKPVFENEADDTIYSLLRTCVATANIRSRSFATHDTRK